MISPDAATIRVKNAMVVDVVYGDERSLLAVLEAVQDLECTKDTVLRGVECGWKKICNVRLKFPKKVLDAAGDDDETCSEVGGTNWDGEGVLICSINCSGRLEVTAGCNELILTIILISALRLLDVVGDGAKTKICDGLADNDDYWGACETFTQVILNWRSLPDAVS
jgi:hypothetical protein